MGTNRRRLEREEAQAREEQRRREDEARQGQVVEATRIIEAWNARLATGRRVLCSPTLGAAKLAGYRWLTVQCPACGMVHDIDLAMLDRHPYSGISGLIPQLSCRSCRPNAPFARLLMLSRDRPEPQRSSSEQA